MHDTYKVLRTWHCISREIQAYRSASPLLRKISEKTWNRKWIPDNWFRKERFGSTAQSIWEYCLWVRHLHLSTKGVFTCKLLLVSAASIFAAWRMFHLGIGLPSAIKLEAVHCQSFLWTPRWRYSVGWSSGDVSFLMMQFYYHMNYCAQWGATWRRPTYSSRAHLVPRCW